MSPNSPSRPPPFPQGMELGQHFRVEALVRLSEGRMFYLVTDDRPDQRHDRRETLRTQVSELRTRPGIRQQVRADQ